MTNTVRTIFICSAFLFALTGCQRGQGASTTPDEEAAVQDPDVLFRTALAYAQRGDTIRAEQYLNAAKNRGYPENEVIPWLVRVCVASSRYNSALRYAETFLRDHPKDWSLRFVTGNIYDALGDPDRAKIEFERVIEQAPSQAPPHYRLAVLFDERFDDQSMARNHYEKYLNLAPDGEHAEEVRETLRAFEHARGPVKVPYPTDAAKPGAEGDPS